MGDQRGRGRRSTRGDCDGLRLWAHRPADLDDDNSCTDDYGGKHGVNKMVTVACRGVCDRGGHERTCGNPPRNPFQGTNTSMASFVLVTPTRASFRSPFLPPTPGSLAQKRYLPGARSSTAG